MHAWQISKVCVEHSKSVLQTESWSLDMLFSRMVLLSGQNGEPLQRECRTTAWLACCRSLFISPQSVPRFDRHRFHALPIHAGVHPCPAPKKGDFGKNRLQRILGDCVRISLYIQKSNKYPSAVGVRCAARATQRAFWSFVLFTPFRGLQHGLPELLAGRVAGFSDPSSLIGISWLLAFASLLPVRWHKEC